MPILTLLFHLSWYQTKTPFLWNISWQLLEVDILQKSYSESFLKILQKTPLKLEESLFFNDVADSIQSQALCNLNQYLFLQILRIFQNNISLKSLCNYLWMGSIYFVNCISKIRLKICQKNMTNVANMLKVVLFTGSPHNLVRRFLECYQDIYLFVNKG